MVRVTGGGGSARPDTLKVTVGYRAGWIGEAQVSYGGPGAAERARLAGEVVLDRLECLGVRPHRDARRDRRGRLALSGSAPLSARLAAPPPEARVRVAARVTTARTRPRWSFTRWTRSG